MSHSFFENKIPHNGYTYKNYLEKFSEIINGTDEMGLDEAEKEKLSHTKLNLQRSTRIEKSYKPSEAIIELVNKIDEPQLWMVLTEAWCGDSAQNIPYLAKIAELNQQIDFRILFRDENPDIMDLYLTNGTRSIPIFVAFNKDGDELFKWGPRPKEAADLVKNAKAEGDPKEVFLEKLHLWYGRNRGKALEDEVKELLTEILV